MCVQFCFGVCVLSCVCWVCAPVGFGCDYRVVGYTKAFVVPGMWCLGVLVRAENSDALSVM